MSQAAAHASPLIRLPWRRVDMFRHNTAQGAHDTRSRTATLFSYPLSAAVSLKKLRLGWHLAVLAIEKIDCLRCASALSI